MAHSSYIPPCIRATSNIVRQGNTKVMQLPQTLSAIGLATRASTLNTEQLSSVFSTLTTAQMASHVAWETLTDDQLQYALIAAGLSTEQTDAIMNMYLSAKATSADAAANTADAAAKGANTAATIFAPSHRTICCGLKGMVLQSRILPNKGICFIRRWFKFFQD